ncbi:MAG: hypothetical protein LBV79_03700 [Candidatus Adiutrix sp.]|jgi:hypothetical protein|nr:hypothetical protein [Candidatus Adiutrix sp.]
MGKSFPVAELSSVALAGCGATLRRWPRPYPGGWAGFRQHQKYPIYRLKIPEKPGPVKFDSGAKQGDLIWETVTTMNRYHRHTGEGRYPFPVAYDFTGQAAAAFLMLPLERFSISRSYAKNEKRPDVCVFCNLLKAGKLQNALNSVEDKKKEEEAGCRPVTLLEMDSGFRRNDGTWKSRYTKLPNAVAGN